MSDVVVDLPPIVVVGGVRRPCVQLVVGAGAEDVVGVSWGGCSLSGSSRRTSVTARLPRNVDATPSWPCSISRPPSTSSSSRQLADNA